MSSLGAEGTLVCNLFLSCKPSFCKIDKKKVENDAICDFDRELETTEEETLRSTGSILVKYSHRKYNYKRQPQQNQFMPSKYPKIVWKLP